MTEQLTTMTKAVAVALDIAGRPDTDDAYALTSIRKAYRLLNGATFQDLVQAPRAASSAPDYGIDWMEAYRVEAAKSDALAEEMRKLAAAISEAKAKETSIEERLNSPRLGTRDEDEPAPRTERKRRQIVETLSQGEYTAQELSRITQSHLRTVQRRLKELIAAGLVIQATDDLSPRYGSASNG